MPCGVLWRCPGLLWLLRRQVGRSPTSLALGTDRRSFEVNFFCSLSIMFGLRAPRLPARRIMSITHFGCVQCTTHMRRRASCTATMLSSRMSSRRISPSLKPTSLQQQLRLTLTFTQTKKNNIQNAIFQVLRSTLVITQNCRSFAKSVDLRKKTRITQSLTWQVEESCLS